MPAYLKHKSLRTLVLLGLFIGFYTTSLYATEITVTKVSSKIVNDIYVVNAILDYELGKKPLEALENGIPLTFYIEVEFEQPRSLMWNKEVIRHNHNMQLEHLPLSDQYVLTNLATKDQFSFESLDDALLKLGRISKLAITEKKRISTNKPLIGKIRTGLVIESLPAPMRIQAWLSSQWRASSGWQEWQIQPW